MRVTSTNEPMRGLPRAPARAPLAPANGGLDGVSAGGMREPRCPGRSSCSPVGRAAILAVSALVLVLGAGCLGYRPLTGRAAFGTDPDASAIEIRIVQNTTGEIGLNGMLADALQEEFARRGVLAPVYPDQGRAADLLLAASVISARAEPTAFSSVALTLEDRIEVVLNVSVERSNPRETVLSRKAVRYSERFLASADPQVYESNKEQALRRIAARAAGQIHDELALAF